MAAAVALCACGCSSFNHEWQAAGKMPASTSGDISGRWEGTWKSEVNGHNGKLRCLIKPGERANHYDAWFHANYFKILSFSYTVDLETKRQGDVFQFTGSADLGGSQGVYNYDGHADRSRFLSTYASKSDHGTFEMLKVTAP